MACLGIAKGMGWGLGSRLDIGLSIFYRFTVEVEKTNQLLRDVYIYIYVYVIYLVN